jgi:GAF domain-containing protein
MAENLIITASNKANKYKELLPQIKALVAGESNCTANLANVAAALKETFNWFWVGFYVVNQDQLILAPFQGPVACTRIKIGNGVCGKAWQNKQTLLVPDVNKFDGHIACSSDSQSEIVIPIFKNETVVAVLDVDSQHLDYFDEIDKKYLEKLCKELETIF